MKTIVRLAGIIVLLWAAGMAGDAQQGQSRPCRGEFH